MLKTLTINLLALILSFMVVFFYQADNSSFDLLTFQNLIYEQPGLGFAGAEGGIASLLKKK